MKEVHIYLVYVIKKVNSNLPGEKQFVKSSQAIGISVLP